MELAAPSAARSARAAIISIGLPQSSPNFGVFPALIIMGIGRFTNLAVCSMVRVLDQRIKAEFALRVSVGQMAESLGIGCQALHGAFGGGAAATK